MNETLIFGFSMVCYILAFVGFSAHISLNRENLYMPSRGIAWAGVIAALVALILRWQSAGHPPLSNMYESLVTLSTFIALTGLIFTRNQPLPMLEAGTCVGSILMFGVASVFASDVKPLIPALQSYWLHLHVSLAFVGEALFAIAFILSYLYCFRKVMTSAAEKNSSVDFLEKAACYLVVVGMPVVFILSMTLLASYLSQQPSYSERWMGLVWGVIAPVSVTMLLLMLLTWMYRGAVHKGVEKWLPDADSLDKLIYRAIALGYPLFTVGGLIFGMVWANKAWGRYWGWDPKETWALITFLVYSIYLHVRLARGWNGTWTACLSIAGFLVTMFTLFGVNFLISGLHSYIG
ncbi:MAG: c-type cytochrome biogenesis protein CcsB [Candidatus Riflebacteria bacterium GWC2_50_8]|nr:MAG: c-type cytochrome biogenesis protein CcsB [Candidatus Riflebacteria bacterium GWC2_50_8]